jgi:hypothetical protein
MKTRFADPGASREKHKNSAGPAASYFVAIDDRIFFQSRKLSSGLSLTGIDFHMSVMSGRFRKNKSEWS